jgi:hypothetical protein
MRSSPNHQAANSRPTKEKLWLSEANKARNAYWTGGSIEDDHIPFMQRGVEVLHIIPTPFPWVWHRPEDNGEHLDIPTVKDWATLVTAFTAEWMNLEGFMPTSGKQNPLLVPRSSEAYLEENDWESGTYVMDHDDL